ncbi:unnamed protein product [Musa hybrid cultivar]
MAVMIWMCSASRILLPQCYFVVVSEMSIFRTQYIVKEKDIVDQNIEGMRSPALHLFMWLGFQPAKLSRAAFHVCMIASGADVIVQTKASPLDDPPNLQGKGMVRKPPACDPKSGFVNVVVSWGIPFPCSILSLSRRVCGCQSIHLQHRQSITDGR